MTEQPQFNQPPATNTVPGAAPTELSQDEKDTVRRAVFGALAYVSQADPGFFATFSESMAGARALGAAPDAVKQVLSGGIVLPEAKSPEDFKASALPNLESAMSLVESRDPAVAVALKQVVLQAVQAVAEASKGTSANEQTAISAIQQALS